MTPSLPTSPTSTPAEAAGANAPILGIDLGTTNSLVAWYEPGIGPRVLGDDADDNDPAAGIVPSVVRYSDDGRVEAVGREARDHAVEFAEQTIASAKRLMGRGARDAAADAPYLGYEIVDGPRNMAMIKLPGDHAVLPQQVSAEILRTLRQHAEAALNTSVARAVVTVPAYFDDAQRQATRDAGRLAGLDVVRIVNEPTAAALAYGIGLQNRRDETIAVFDLGGGTFDVSILRVTPAEADDPAATDFFEVVSTAGDTRLGGDDFDRAIMQLVIREIGEQVGGELDFPPSTRQALRTLAEQAKIRLSTVASTQFEIEVGEDDGEESVYRRELTRDEFERMITPLIDRALDACTRALRDAKLKPFEVDRVVMVGGSTRVPLVRQRVAEFFDAEPYTALDPDRVVALGAAVQASIIAGGQAGAGEMLLLDVIPLSLGIETAGGAVAKLIIRNSTVPARATEMFSTSVDGQTSIKINVLQGEREMAADCRSLGVFHLSGIPPMPAGIPQLEVEFLIDANGVLRVHAHERRSGKRAQVQIVPNHGLSREEVERIEAESLTHARDDMQRHRVTDLITNAKLDIKWTREGLDAIGDGLDANIAGDLRTLADQLEELIKQAERDWRSVDANAFHELKERLDRASVPLHEARIAHSLRDE